MLRELRQRRARIAGEVTLKVDFVHAVDAQQQNALDAHGLALRSSTSERAVRCALIALAAALVIRSIDL